jgi:hypothetical protein
MVGICNGGTVCFRWGKNCNYKYYQINFMLIFVMTRVTNPYGIYGGRSGNGTAFSFSRLLQVPPSVLHQRSILICTVLLSEEQTGETGKPSNNSILFPKSGKSKEKYFHFTCLKSLSNSKYRHFNTILTILLTSCQPEFQITLLHI